MWGSSAARQWGDARSSDPLYRYETLLEVSDVIHSCRNLDDLFRQLAECLRRLVPFDAVSIGLLTEDKKSIRIALLESWIPQAVGVGFSVPLDEVPGGWVIEHQKPLRVRVCDREPRYRLHNDTLAKSGLALSLHLPLTTALNPLGELVFVFKDEVEWPHAEVEFMERIADQVAVAIENATNFDEVRRAHEEARTAERQRMQERDRVQLLMDLSSHLATNLELRDLMQAVVRSVRLFMECRIVNIHLPDANGVLQMHAYGLDSPAEGWDLQTAIARVQEIDKRRKTKPGETLQGKVFRSGKPLVSARLDPVEYARELEILAPLGVVGGCAIPLIHRGKVFGTIGLGRREEQPFTEDEVNFLMKFGSQVALAIENALAYQEISCLKEKLAQEKHYLEDEIRSETNFDEIIGESPALRAVLKQVSTVAMSDANVLILGETGTGKELIARAIHESSKRKGRTFVKLNCAAIPTGLLESELFGHEKGAFTGAIAQKIGRMELANGGTLFLDEVGDIPLELQPKLLRALQEREFERLGSTRTLKADIRFLAATHRDLREMITTKQFRSDLFYRLNVFPITIPPLRERKGDISRLIRYFVSKYAKKMDKKIEAIPNVAMEKLQAWHWPGNVRELENFIERSVILTQGSDLHVPLSELESVDVADLSSGTLRDSERDHIVKALRDTRGVLAGPEGAAARLGVKRTTLQYKIKKLGIAREDYS